MTHFQLFVILLRTMAVYFIAQGLPWIEVTISTLLRFGDGFSSWAMTAATLVASIFSSFIFGILLWKFAERIAKYGSNFEGEASGGTSIGSTDALQQVLLSTMGIWLISVEVPELIREISTRYLLLSELNVTPQPSDMVSKIGTTTVIIGTLLKVFFGVGLVLGAQKVTFCIAKLREISKRT